MNANQKKIYTQPMVSFIRLDYEVSLALESTPPELENESLLRLPESVNENPFKINRT